MNTHATTDKGHIRSQEILRTAQAILASEGYAGLSMRGVATQLGISLSTVQHYYTNKEALVEALLIYVMDNYQAAVAQVMNAMSDKSQLERFKTIIDLILIEIRRPETFGVLAEIYALSNRLPFAARLVEAVYARERKEIFKLIYGLEPKISKAEYKLRAAMIVVQIHGLVSQLAQDNDPSLSRRQLEQAAKQSFLMLATKA
ncbi:MAG: TetR/AcrR family transcriptional regulator [Limnobacter sp.]|jgi:AcrR family transcriptional regulator|uniref:TetR/AcrR family transcriptional regulator n=1 Tax=Limnobacter profundi TaxID=2732163 RepID=A0ABX6N762_9BURK|nr:MULTISPECIES: TetR/AcrR family transcriptional regulator [unclassified Limnobacter]MAG79964.1 TetR family transcriptional regulator [Sutterellaceae bacterium]MBA4314995.1 TetR family transcriptional regulator [Alcaligenaceae bacterium]MBU0541994.1 TetR/AcrR family transcriptional regulator [Gammaproteobacteria bacterium]PZO18462.1 MAG: TetR family transcriptional regulator [Betaproteobacteria bacterium]MBT85444.1 TetR family transcriptional regulator [Sutterellaceae bacterium]|tara:strand:- start:1065 stop:1670 length:606 start_codon:yes stop_codon:yes gene_type:complete